MIDDGLDAPYSCREGICGACACRLLGGEVEMAHNEVLEAEDLAEGYVLACQSVALTRRSASRTRNRGGGVQLTAADPRPALPRAGRHRHGRRGMPPGPAAGEDAVGQGKRAA